jgi:hypothetical protein
MRAAAADKKKIDLQKEAVCLSVKLGMLRTKRRIQTEQIITDADKEMVHVAKSILESPELQAIDRWHGQVRSYLKSRCLPSPFRHGVYLIRLTLVSEVMEKLGEFERGQKELIETFMTYYTGVYEQRTDANSPLRQRLQSLYDPSDYPAPERVRRAFRFETQLWEIGTPGALKSLDRALYERELAKMQNVWDEARNAITQVLLKEFRDMTKRLADRLTPGEDGKPKVFRDSLVGNLQEWLDVFDQRALTDDDDLVALVQKARALISGIKPDTIRESEGLKAEVAQEMQLITERLDACIVEKPGRLIDLDDD